MAGLGAVLIVRKRNTPVWNLSINILQNLEVFKNKFTKG